MKNIKFFIILFSITAGFGSCKKALEQSDPQSFSDVNAFTTIDHVQLGVNGAYGDYSAYVYDIYKNALTSDELKVGPQNGGSGALTFRLQYGSDGTSGADVTAGYYDYYGTIDQINRVLPHIYTVTGGTQQRKDELKGQLLALRAISHFGLLQAWSNNYDPSGLGIAVMTAFDASAKPARNSMGEVMTQIEADLTEAKGLVPAVTPATFSDTIMNKVNIAAYQARIALYKRDYDAAATYATEVISSGVKPLVDNQVDFIGIWKDINTKEVLFRIRFATSSFLGGLFTTPSGSIQWSPSDKLTNSYNASDYRLPVYISTSSTGRSVNKYSGSTRGAGIVDLKACRIAEMYLIRAEANAKKSSPDLIAGASDLNYLRTFRIPGYTNQTFASAGALVDAILQERFKELCFEGFRFYDLRRNNLPVERASTDVTSTLWQTLPTGSDKFVYPIPEAAILANPNTQQNPGY